MLDLSTISFKVDTSELDRAGKAIGELVTNVGKLDKAARDAAQTEATLARAAKDNAKANLDNAKAQDVRLKSTITADKADQQAAAVIGKKTKATEKATEASAKNVGVLQRQKDILEFQTQGFSKGQSSILAYGKAAGLAADDIGELGKVLETQRKLMGGDPFDKSLSGLKSLQNQYTELKESVRQYATDSNLTAKQTRELARDKERLIEKMKVEGASFSEIRKAVRAHNAEYVNLAASYNKMTSAEDAVIKSRKDAVSATNYLTQADQKMAAALNTSNAALDKGGTDSLVKYESALRRSGVSQDVATQKLATYKAQLTQVAAAEEKRRSQHLARALTPQISDVVVSLWSGQSPMTVLLQQGAQVNDLFQLSGVAAADFGKTVKQAFTSMLPAIMTVVKGVGGLIVDGFMAAGKAVAGFLGNISGMTAAMNTLYGVMSQDGPSKWGGWIRGAGMLLSGIFATGVGAAVAGLIAFGVALKQVIIESNELNRAVALNGGTLGATAVIAETYVARLGAVTGSSSKANEALIAMAKAGNITSSSMMMVGEAAIALNKAVGVPIEETVKQFDKLATAPGKTLAELAKSTGLIKAETLELVLQYERVGQTSKAAEVAQKAYADASKSAAVTVKENYGALTTFAMQVKSIFSGMWDTILGVGRADNLDTRIDQLRQRIIENSQATPGIFLTKERIEQDTKDLNAQFYVLVQQRKAQMDIGQAKADAVKASAAVVESEKLSAQYSSTVEKHQLEITKLQNQRAQWEKDGLLTKDRELLIAKGIAEEQKKINEANKPKSSPSENYYAALMREATNNTIAANTAAQELTKSEQKLLEVRADPRFEKLNAIQKQDVVAKYESAIAAEKQTALTEKLADAEEHRLKLLGKSEGIGKQYYSDMQKLEEFAKVAGWSRSEVEELTRAIFMSTPAWKAYEKALEDVNSAARKFNEDSLASQASTLKENESLDYRLSLLGKTTEEQKALSIEYNRANKLREVDIKLAKQLRDIEEKIAKAKKDGLPESDYKALVDAEVQARKDAAEQAKAINREVAVQYAEDLQKEIDAIKNGISDSIVTALFEGGKAGSQKLRSVLMDALKKPVTMVVNAVVNTLFGSVLGSIFGGGGGAAGVVSGGGGALGMLSNGATAVNLLTSGYAGGVGSLVGGIFGQTAGNAALASSLGLGSSSAAAAASGASVAAGGTGAGAGLGASLGAAVPYIAIAAIVAMSWKKLFGRELKDYGIQGEFGGESGFEGQQYKFYKGGLFRSDKTELSPLDEAMRKTLADSFKMMKKQVIDFADILGLNSDRLAEFSSSIKLSLKGLSEQDANAKIQEALATVNNEMAQEILGTWKTVTKEVDKVIWQSATVNDSPTRVEKELVEVREYTPSEYAREGEKAIDTLTRLATSLSVVNQVFDTLGVKLFDTSLAGGDLASQLVDLFGSIDEFVKSTTFYYQNFYTEAERQATAYRQLEAEFKKQNITLPKTREEYRKLVEAQDLSTEEGRKMYQWLLSLAPAFAEISKTAEDIARDAADKLKNALEEAYTALEEAVKAQIDILKEQETAQTGVVNNLKAIFDLLKKNVRELYMQVDSTAGMLASQGRGVISNAISTGTLPDIETLTEAITAVRAEIDSTSYATQFEQDKARLQFAADLKILQDSTEEQLSTEELILKAIKDQIKYFENLLIEARKQVDAILGVSTAVLTVAEALANLTSLMFPDVGDTRPEPAPGSSGGGAVWGPGGGGTATKDSKYKQVTSLGSAGVGYIPITDTSYISKLDSLSGIYHSFDGTGNLAGLLDAIKAAGGDLADLSALSGYFVSDWEKAAASVDKQFATGGAFTNGIVKRPTSFNIGEMGEAGPEAIMPLTNVGGRLGVSVSGSDGSSALADRVASLEFALQAIAVNTGKMARILDAAQGEDGRSIMTSDAPTT